jgi:hypothetical protein
MKEKFNLTEKQVMDIFDEVIEDLKKMGTPKSIEKKQIAISSQKIGVIRFLVSEKLKIIKLQDELNKLKTTK